MSPYRRNIFVGVTVLAGLGVLGWMILKFGDRPVQMFTEAQLHIQFTSDRADGIAPGSAVLYRGVNVGRVSDVSRADMNNVVIEAEVEANPPLPANVEGVIRTQSVLGAGSAMSLELTGAAPEGRLQEHAKLAAHFTGGFIPPEFSDLARDLRETSRQFRESNLVLHMDQAVLTIQKQVEKAGKMFESIDSMVSDQKIKGDLQASVANFRAATESAKNVAAKLDKLSDDATATIAQARTTIDKTGGKIDDLSKQMGDRLLQVSKLLDSFQSISAKIDKGQGTAGLLVNDPKLYEALVDSSRELNATISDLKRLVEQWEQEGVSMKLK